MLRALAYDELLTALLCRRSSLTPGKACASTMSSGAVGSDGAAHAKDPLVMYVALRRDLDWPMGAMVNQACHACAAVAWEARDDAQAAAFFSEAEGQMTQFTMGVDDLGRFEKLVEKLRAADVPHR